MAVSNSYNYNDTRDTIIKDALCMIGILGEEESPTTDQTNICDRALNRLVKSLERYESLQTNETTAVIFLNYNDPSYALSSTGDHAAQEFVSTTASAGSGTSLTVASTSGMTALDNIGIMLSTGLRQWTTIASVDSSTGLTLNASLTGSVSADATVYSYTTRLPRPNKIVMATLYKSSADLEYLLQDLPLSDFNQLPNKSVINRPLSYTYQGSSTAGNLRVYPRPDNGDDYILAQVILPIMDLDSGTDNLDLVSHWNDCIVANLAVSVAPIFQINIAQKFPELMNRAKELLDELKGFEKNDGSVFLVPE